MLLLNTTTGGDSSSSKNNYGGSGSGEFSFEFNKTGIVQAKAIARKRVIKPVESVEPVKLRQKQPKIETPIKLAPKPFQLAPSVPTPTFEPSTGLPKQLPTVDFPDEPRNKRGNKNNKPERPAHPLNASYTTSFKPNSNKKDHRDGSKPYKKSLEKKSVEKVEKVKNYVLAPPKSEDEDDLVEPVTQPDPVTQPEPVKKPKAPKSPKTVKIMKPFVRKDNCDDNKNVFSVDSVESLKIHPHSIKNMKEVLNFHTLTHVQQKAVPPGIEGRDLLIKSPTGSGKTLSYALPIVELLHNIRPKLTRADGIHALVIVPTRELAVQTYELFLKLVKPFQWIVPGYLSGGEKRKAEKARLSKGINILISTPGRICDHLMHTESMKFNKVQIFALDEADRLLELGYENDVKKVVDTINDHNTNSKKIQKILLSATLTSSVKKLAGLTLSDPVCVDNDTVDTMDKTIGDENQDDLLVIPEQIEQKFFMVPPKLKFAVLCSLIIYEMKRGAKKILIFFPTQNVVDFHYDILVEILTQHFIKKEKSAKSYLNEDEEEEEASDGDESDILLPNVTLFKLFGSMTQVERTSVFREFKKKPAGILLCTDVASRGLDVPKLDIVVQYSAPQELNNYVHRIGRTARAGDTGSAIIFMTRNEEKFIDLLREKKIDISEDDYHKCLKSLVLPGMPPKSFFEEKILVLQKRLEQLLNDDSEVREKASKAFTSWICYYKTFSKELRSYFQLREIHMGHVANSFGLREPPKSIARQYSTGEDAPKPKNRRFDFEHRDFVARGPGPSLKMKKKYADFTKSNFGRSANISEFDSGLPEVKKKKT